jgi:hypothetical protein
MPKSENEQERTPANRPPGHDPSGPGESENAPGHNKPTAEPREDMNDAAREEMKRREDQANSRPGEV